VGKELWGKGGGRGRRRRLARLEDVAAGGDAGGRDSISDDRISDAHISDDCIRLGTALPRRPYAQSADSRQTPTPTPTPILTVGVVFTGK
jgi:hypothetical protein